MSTKYYSYQDKTTEMLPGETWQHIPGFEDYYQASDLGSIRSLDRVVPHSRLGSQFVKGRILTQSICRNRNIKTGEPMIDLRVTLMVENRSFYFNVRRLVYMTFIGAIDFENDGLYVINKDSDGYNNQVDNLELVTKSTKQQRIFDRDRLDTHLKTADRTKWGKAYGGVTRRKPVNQYDLNGRFLKQYPSIAEASRQTGCGQKEIILVARGKHRHAGGFIWKYG